MVGEGGSWLRSRPSENIETDKAGGLVLRRARGDDVAGLVAAINGSLEHLRPWMSWARRPATTRRMQGFVEASDLEWDAGRGFQYLIRTVPSGPVVGGCGLHARNGPGVLEIGYWVHVDHLRRGIATAATEALMQAAFELPEVDRVEITHEAANTASAAVPAKLGFRPAEPVPVRYSAPGGQPLASVWALDRLAERGGERGAQPR